jgi:hypothetical protein
VEQHRATIEAEVKAMQGNDYIDEMYDLLEALVDIEEALGWIDFGPDED